MLTPQQSSKFYNPIVLKILLVIVNILLTISFIFSMQQFFFSQKKYAMAQVDLQKQEMQKQEQEQLLTQAEQLRSLHPRLFAQIATQWTLADLVWGLQRQADRLAMQLIEIHSAQNLDGLPHLKQPSFFQPIHIVLHGSYASFCAFIRMLLNYSLLIGIETMQIQPMIPNAQSSNEPHNTLEMRLLLRVFKAPANEK